MPRLIDALVREHDEFLRLLDGCLTDERAVDLRRFEEFRRRQLRHVALEERVLMPALARRLGAPPVFQNGLRKDHASVAALCVAEPNPDFLVDLRELLAWHNRGEEAPGGLYALCGEHLGGDSALDEEAAKLAPLVLPPYGSGPSVVDVLREVMRAIGVTPEGPPRR